MLICSVRVVPKTLLVKMSLLMRYGMSRIPKFILLGVRLYPLLRKVKTEYISEILDCRRNLEP